MNNRNICFYLLLTGILLAPVNSLKAQQADYRPELFFREDWKEIPAELPVNQGHVENPNLTLHLYGPGKDGIKKSHHDKPVDDPYYIWSGPCEANWMVALEHKDAMVDLSGYARIRWRTKQAGFRQLRVTLKLSDGTWLVSRESDGQSGDWRIKEFVVGDMQWFQLDPQTIIEQKEVENPDLTQVIEIGFTDLMRGGRGLACSRLDWIEVYGETIEK
jgi:hypothetical protein